MNTEIIAPFHVIGIEVRTTNEAGQAMKDIPALWGRFTAEDVAARIPNKVNDTVYGIYTDYELDHTKPYTTLIGCAVSDLDTIPEGLIGKTIEGGNYIRFTAKGDVHRGSVITEWVRIWSANLPRAFTADFEIYGAAAANPADAEVPIMIAVKAELPAG